MAEVTKDYKELLELLNEKRVEYLIVGAYALAFHGHPRFTGDIDILVSPTGKNGFKLFSKNCFSVIFKEEPPDISAIYLTHGVFQRTQSTSEYFFLKSLCIFLWQVSSAQYLLRFDLLKYHKVSSQLNML